ncbi:MAG: hypothetical protein ACO1RA_02310 [Planctomycetaceae bacterium]
MARKMQETMHGAGESQIRMNSLTGSAVRQAITLGAQWLSVSSYIQMAAQYLQEYNAIAEKGNRTQISVGAAQSRYVNNLSSSSSDQIRDSIKQIEEGRVRTGFPSIEHAYEAATAAASATGGNPVLSAQATEIAMGITKHNPTSASGVAGAVGSIADATGLNGQQAAGLMMSIGGQSRLESLESQSKNIPQIVTSNLSRIPEDQRLEAIKQKGAAYATISKLGNDKTGDASTTAFIALENALNDMFTKGVDVSAPGGFKYKYKPKVDPKLIGDRLNALAADPKAAKIFEDTFQFEKRFESPIHDLVTGNAAKLFADNKSKIRIDEELYKEKVAQQNTLTPQMQLSSLQAGASGNLQDFELSQTNRAARAQADQITLEAMAQTRSMAPSLKIPYLGAGADRAKDFLSGVLPDEQVPAHGIARIEERQKKIRQHWWGSWMEDSIESAVPLPGIGRGLRGSDRKFEDLSPEEKKQYQFLEDQKQELKRIADFMAENNRQLREMNDRGKQKQPQIAPAMQGQREAHQER